MANILIDGYNLIGTAHGDLKQARDDIIEKLSLYALRKNHHVTLVFDGWKDGSLTGSKITSRNLTIIYSRLGETADTAIKNIIRPAERPWIVVSSDREISSFAEKMNQAAVSSQEFEDRLVRSRRDNSSGSEFFEDDDAQDSHDYAERKPVRLPKRERIKLKAREQL